MSKDLIFTGQTSMDVCKKNIKITFEVDIPVKEFEKLEFGSEVKLVCDKISNTFTVNLRRLFLEYITEKGWK